MRVLTGTLVSFLYCRREAVQSSFCCRATFVICFCRSLLSFSLPFYFFSAFLRSLLSLLSYLWSSTFSLSVIFSLISHLSFSPCVRPVSSGSQLCCQLPKPRFQFLLTCDHFCNGLHNSEQKLCRDGHHVEFCCLKWESQSRIVSMTFMSF